jgi:hypothetical protein
MGKGNEIKSNMPLLSVNSCSHSESAVSNAIAFILLFGIIFSVYSAIHLGYMPEWKSETEISHMTDVWNDMTEIKSQLDRVTLLLMSIPVEEQKSPISNVNKTVSFHPGNPKIPLIDSTKFSGTLSVNTDQCIMTVIPADGNETKINCGTISYRSNNKYYVDQIFRYENGALILAQEEQAIMKLFPAIRVFEDSAGNCTFLINTVEIQGPINKLSSGSDCTIRLGNYSFNSMYDENVNNFTLEIETDYPEAWGAYFREVMKNAGLKKEDYYLETDESRKLLEFSFPAENDSIGLKRLCVSKTAVSAELGIGLS